MREGHLSWQGMEKIRVYSIYSKPSLDWHREAGQIAAQWLDGHVAAVEAKALAYPSSVAAYVRRGLSRVSPGWIRRALSHGERIVGSA